MPLPAMGRRNTKGIVPDEAFYSFKDLQDRTDLLSKYIPYSGTTGSIGGSSLTAGQTATGTVVIPGATEAVQSGASIQSTPVLNGAPGLGFTWNGHLTTAKDTVQVVVTCIANGTPTASKYNVKIIP